MSDNTNTMTDSGPSSPVNEPAEVRIEAGIASVVAALSYELDDGGRAAVREKVIGHLGLGDALRAYPLANSDEPDFIFRVYRAEG